jgi:hypothetical protein
VFHYRYLNGVWQDPVPAAGVPAWQEDRAALVARDDGTLELVTVGADQLPRHSRFLNATWSPPQPIGSLAAALRPALIVGTDAQVTLELVFVGDGGVVYHQRFSGGVWGTPRALQTGSGPLVAAGPPALAAVPDARVELVVPAADCLYHNRMKDGIWSDAYRLAPLTAQAVALVAQPPDDPSALLELFVTATDGTVSQFRFSSGQWSGPTSLAGLLAVGAAAPAAR